MDCAKHTIGSKIILDTPDGTGDRLQWKLVMVCLEIGLILRHDRCTVYAKCTIGSKIILETVLVLV
jgi:hypothetical protein